MARFSLSPTASSIRRPTQSSTTQPSSLSKATSPPAWKWNFPPRDGYNYRSASPQYRDVLDDDWSSESSDDDDTSSSSSSEVSEQFHESSPPVDSDDDDEEEEEPPHPLGFESQRYGRTRFGISLADVAAASSLRPQDIFDRDDEYAWNALIHIDDDDERRRQSNNCEQSFPPVVGGSYHLNHHGNDIPTKRLLRGAARNKESTQMDDLLSGMDRIANLVKAAGYVDDDSNNQQQREGGELLTTQPRDMSKLLQLATACERQQKSLPIEMSKLQRRNEQSYESYRQGFLLLLEADKRRVSSANERIAQRERQLKDMEERERMEQLAHVEEMRQRRELEEREEAKRQAAKAARTEEDRIKERQRIERLKKAEEEAELDAAKKNAHITRAQSLIANLESVRTTTLRQFDKDKGVGRRRLQFKKIVNGKINTLSHDEHKVLEVGRMVSEAINNAANDDNAAAASSGGGDPVASMGKKYLLDLLASNLIVRVQADGYNGTRGDGFPLAGMFAYVSTQCEEIGPVLEGHLYTVCPTAIPTLSLGAVREGEGMDELMESLGMIRDKEGVFESFDKFLNRTEVSEERKMMCVVSLVRFYIIFVFLNLMPYIPQPNINAGSNLDNGRHHVLPTIRAFIARRTRRCTDVVTTIHGYITLASGIAPANTNRSCTGGLLNRGGTHARQ